jgi:hypothetical protein
MRGNRATSKRAKSATSARGGTSRATVQRSPRTKRAAKRVGAKGLTATKSRARSGQDRRWSGIVTARSDALDLEPSVFKSTSAAAIARSLKRSAENSRRRKGTPFQSAMSMLNFYINRGGANLSARRKGILQKAKTELRRAFHREP